jgi:hypothetical protein
LKKKERKKREKIRKREISWLVARQVGQPGLAIQWATSKVVWAGHRTFQRFFILISLLFFLPSVPYFYYKIKFILGM